MSVLLNQKVAHITKHITVMRDGIGNCTEDLSESILLLELPLSLLISFHIPDDLIMEIKFFLQIIDKIIDHLIICSGLKTVLIVIGNILERSEAIITCRFIIFGISHCLCQLIIEFGFDSRTIDGERNFLIILYFTTDECNNRFIIIGVLHFINVLDDVHTELNDLFFYIVVEFTDLHFTVKTNDIFVLKLRTDDYQFTGRDHVCEEVLHKQISLIGTGYLGVDTADKFDDHHKYLLRL